MYSKVQVSINSRKLEDRLQDTGLSYHAEHQFQYYSCQSLDFYRGLCKKHQ